MVDLAQLINNITMQDTTGDGFKFDRASDAFGHYYSVINDDKNLQPNGTRAIYNCAFTIMRPMENEIEYDFRNWSQTYALREWLWYNSKSNNVLELQKYAPIWAKMHNGDGIVNSNYGYLWDRGKQLDYVAKELKRDPNSRRAWLSLYDGKENMLYDLDTPCTLAIGFRVFDGTLCMQVVMRSNDLWYGFCNDQYCFSMLQKTIAKMMDMPVGWYHHYAADMHLYEKHWDKA